MMPQHRLVAVRALLRDRPDDFSLLREVFDSLIEARQRAGYPELPVAMSKADRLAAIRRATERKP